MEGVGRLGWCGVDCADPLRLAAFWSQVLGMEIDEGQLGDPPHYVGLIPSTPGGPVITFNRVPEPKSVKNRLHFDIEVNEVESATARVLELGGHRAPTDDFDEYGFRWRVMSDPEGNEFCLIFGTA
jgi:predicted enzyme related to lactoylglutathione lyase